MLLNPRRWLRQLKPTFFTLICIGALILLRNLAYDNSVYQSISLHQKMEYQIFSSFYQKDESVRRVFRKKVAHLNELGLSNVHDNIPVQDDIVCRHPKLDLSNDANRAAFYDVGSIQCFGRELFTFKNGALRFNKTSLRRDVIKKCSYQAVERIDDNYATYTTPLIRNSSPFDMVLQHDFIRIQCYFEIEEHTEYQRNLLSMNLRHGKHLLSIPKKQAEKNGLQDGVKHGETKNGIVQLIQESGTIMTRKKTTQHLQRSPFNLPKGYSQESILSHKKLAKNRTILSSPKIESLKNPNKIHYLNQSKFADKKSLNILQDHLQESGAKKRIRQPPKTLKHPKKAVKELEHSVLDIHKPLSVQNHQLRPANYDGVKKGIFSSNPNPKSIKKSNKLVEIHKPTIFGQPHSNPDKNPNHPTHNNIRKSSGKLFVSEDSSAKNMLSARVLANKTKLHNLSNSNLRIKNHGQQQNNSHLVQRRTKTQLVKKNKKNSQLSALSKQKNSVKQRTDSQLSHTSHLKKINKLVNYKSLNKTIPVFKNISSKMNHSQTNKKDRIFFREVNYPELNQKPGFYPVKKKEIHLTRGSRFDAIYLKPSLHQKSQPVKISRKGNSSLWQNGVWSLAKLKPIHKYLKKIPTHLDQLPELKQQKNIQLDNKNTNINIKRSSSKESPAKTSAVPHLTLAPRENPSMSQPVGTESNFYDRIKTSIPKSGTKISHPNVISSSHENKVPQFPHFAQTDQTFDIFAIKPKSSEVKKNAKVNDSISYDSSREMYINLPPEDYGINEELPDIEQFFVQIFPKPEVFQRISEVPPFVRINVIPLNILIYGLDSLSHLSFQRKLPNTYKYLKDSLNAIIMNGYNIVGDATTAAIIPLLTGNYLLHYFCSFLNNFFFGNTFSFSFLFNPDFFPFFFFLRNSFCEFYKHSSVFESLRASKDPFLSLQNSLQQKQLCTIHI